jgi:hypothetical protein
MSQPPQRWGAPPQQPGWVRRPAWATTAPTTRSPNCPWYRHPWVIPLAGFVVGGMVGVNGSGPDPTTAPATVTVTSLDGLLGIP